MLQCHGLALKSGRKKKTSKQPNKTRQNKKANEVFFSISLEWLNNALFGKEIAIGLRPLPQCSLLPEKWIFICQVIRISEPLLVLIVPIACS